MRLEKGRAEGDGSRANRCGQGRCPARSRTGASPRSSRRFRWPLRVCAMPWVPEARPRARRCARPSIGSPMPLKISIASPLAVTVIWGKGLDQVGARGAQVAQRRAGARDRRWSRPSDRGAGGLRERSGGGLPVGAERPEARKRGLLCAVTVDRETRTVRGRVRSSRPASAPSTRRSLG